MEYPGGPGAEADRAPGSGHIETLDRAHAKLTQERDQAQALALSRAIEEGPMTDHRKPANPVHAGTLADLASMIAAGADPPLLSWEILLRDDGLARRPVR